jgi:hypothetical protein
MDNGKFIGMLTICKDYPSHYFNIDTGRTLANISRNSEENRDYILILQTIVSTILLKSHSNFRLGPNQDCVLAAITLILFPEFLSISLRKPMSMPHNEEESIGELRNIKNELEKLAELQEFLIKSSKRSEQLIAAIDTLNTDFQAKVTETSKKYDIPEEKIIIDVTDNPEFNSDFDEEFSAPPQQTLYVEPVYTQQPVSTPQPVKKTFDKYYDDATRECRDLQKDKKGNPKCDDIYDTFQREFYNKKIKCTQLSGTPKFRDNFRKCSKVFDHIRKNKV